METIFKEAKEVMSEYCEADLHDRIVMFLHYRELRPNFAEVDQVKRLMLKALKESENIDMSSDLRMSG
jgi:hypothetical protein